MHAYPIGPAALFSASIVLALVLFGACADWVSNPYGTPSNTPVAPCDLSKDPESVCRKCIETNCCTEISECTETYPANCNALAECWQGLHLCPSFAAWDGSDFAVWKCLEANCAGVCTPDCGTGPCPNPGGA
jgi:hypothetical protein